MKSQTKFMAITMIFIVIIFSSSTLLYKNIVSIAKTNLSETTESFRKQQFKLIWGSLEYLIAQAEEESKKVALAIEEDLRNLPEENLNRLQEDMTNQVINKDLHSILLKNIENKNFNNINNHRNGIIIMSLKGYIEDFNYRRADINNHNSIVRDWESSLGISYNKELDADAIDKLINRSSGVIALESYDLTKDDNHILINELTYDSLLEVFCKEGISGLRNYQILVPSYITDTGDIFGTSDIVHGSKVDNHKLIVVQEFNLYDQIIINDNGIFNDEEINQTISRYNNLFRWLHSFGIVMIASVCALIFYMCGIYNRAIEYECDDEENNTPTNNP